MAKTEPALCEVYKRLAI